MECVTEKMFFQGPGSKGDRAAGSGLWGGGFFAVCGEWWPGLTERVEAERTR